MQSSYWYISGITEFPTRRAKEKDTKFRTAAVTNNTSARPSKTTKFNINNDPGIYQYRVLELNEAGREEAEVERIVAREQKLAFADTDVDGSQTVEIPLRGS